MRHTFEAACRPVSAYVHYRHTRQLRVRVEEANIGSTTGAPSLVASGGKPVVRRPLDGRHVEVVLTYVWLALLVPAAVVMLVIEAVEPSAPRHRRSRVTA